MLDKKEIEKEKDRCNSIIEFCENNKECQENNICPDCYIEIEDIKAIKTLLQYINQLEQKEKRLIYRLENDVINITKTLQDGKHCDDYSRCRLKAYRTKTKEILRLIGGENE